ncbi:TnpV protein [Lawsonibacter sp. OA9]|uniref:TnpV protein n=1 Tax=Oscillospiraceae TaxID=216572 RepID=UPI00399B4132
MRAGDYYLFNPTIPEVNPLGVWWPQSLQYIWKHRNAIYTASLLGGKLHYNLTEIDRQVKDSLPVC